MSNVPQENLLHYDINIKTKGRLWKLRSSSNIVNQMPQTHEFKYVPLLPGPDMTTCFQAP